MAVEDAAALGVLFSDMTSEDEVSARLELFNKLRVNRVAGTQIISSMHKWDPTQVSKDDSGYFEGNIPRTYTQRQPILSYLLTPYRRQRRLGKVQLRQQRHP